MRNRFNKERTGKILAIVLGILALFGVKPHTSGVYENQGIIIEKTDFALGLVSSGTNYVVTCTGENPQITTLGFICDDATITQDGEAVELPIDVFCDGATFTLTGEACPEQVVTFTYVDCPCNSTEAVDDDFTTPPTATPSNYDVLGNDIDDEGDNQVITTINGAADPTIGGVNFTNNGTDITVEITDAFDATAFDSTKTENDTVFIYTNYQIEDDGTPIATDEAAICLPIPMPVVEITSTLTDSGTIVTLGTITKPDGSSIACGECAELIIKDADGGVLETINTTTGTPPDPADSDAVAPYISVLSYFTPAGKHLFPCDGSQVDFEFDKKQWSIDNGYSQTATSDGIELEFIVRVGGFCDNAAPNCVIPSVADTAYICKIIAWAVDNQAIYDPENDNGILSNNMVLSSGVVTVAPSSWQTHPLIGSPVGSITEASVPLGLTEAASVAADDIIKLQSQCLPVDRATGQGVYWLRQTGNEDICSVVVGGTTLTLNEPIPTIPIPPASSNPTLIFMVEISTALNANTTFNAAVGKLALFDVGLTASGGVNCETQLFNFSIIAGCDLDLGPMKICNNPDNGQSATLTPLPAPYYNY